MIINDENITLQDQYKLTMTSDELHLFTNDQKIGSLDIKVDSLYKLPKYKLLGINYDKLMVIDYFDGLKVEQEFEMSGCTDILPFSHHIIAISNKNLMKINLETK